MAEAKKKWIQKAIKKPGALRKQLSIKGSKPIPPGTLINAAKKKGVVGRRARLAETLKGFQKGGKAKPKAPAKKSVKALA